MRSLETGQIVVTRRVDFKSLHNLVSLMLGEVVVT